MDIRDGFRYCEVDTLILKMLIVWLVKRILGNSAQVFEKQVCFVRADAPIAVLS